MPRPANLLDGPVWIFGRSRCADTERRGPLWSSIIRTRTMLTRAFSHVIVQAVMPPWSREPRRRGRFQRLPVGCRNRVLQVRELRRLLPVRLA